MTVQWTVRAANDRRACAGLVERSDATCIKTSTRPAVTLKYKLIFVDDIGCIYFKISIIHSIENKPKM